MNDDTNDIGGYMHRLGTRARTTARILCTADSEHKNLALRQAAAQLRLQSETILVANAHDVQTAITHHASPAFVDRLSLTNARIEAMALGLENVAALAEPVGQVLEEWRQPPHGLYIRKVSVPLGVIGMIYESRPNVTADAAGLCLKAGNAVILRGGSESLHSSKAIVACLHDGLKQAGLPKDAIQLVATTNRAAVDIMLTMHESIDVLIPRGGASLTAHVAAHSRVPTLLHLDGNCHTYIHASADADTATRVALNAKMRRTGICGATESLLIDDAACERLLPALLHQLRDAGCSIRGDARVQSFGPEIVPATEEDWQTEYLDAIISIKTVRDVQEAVDHINCYGSHHTDAIIAQDEHAIATFSAGVDSAIVMVNTSTQFADGGEFGMGGEIGIATGRLHARGPVGCKQLTTYKYVVQSSGATRP